MRSDLGLPNPAYRHGNDDRLLRPNGVPPGSASTPVKLMNERESSEMLGLSVRTLQAWRVRGEGPNFVKMGHRVSYRLSDLQAWIDANVFSSTTAAQHGER